MESEVKEGIEGSRTAATKATVDEKRWNATPASVDEFRKTVEMLSRDLGETRRKGRRHTSRVKED